MQGSLPPVGPERDHDPVTPIEPADEPAPRLMLTVLIGGGEQSIGGAALQVVASTGTERPAK